MESAAGVNSCELVDRLKSNEEAAWDLLVGRYAKPLCQLVRRALPRAIQSKVDEDDVVQEVFRSIYVRLVRGDFACDSDARLWPILCIRARKRIRGEVRRHRAARRDMHREKTGFSRRRDDEQDEAEPADGHLGAEGLASIRDELLGFINTLDPRSQVVVYLRLDSYTLEEVAELLQCSLRTVESIWAGVQRRAKAVSIKE